MSAIDLTKRAAVVLEKFTDAAKEDPSAWDVFPEAELYLGADHSGSMRAYYSDPRQPVVQLAKQILAIGLARLDPDGKIPLWFYASRAGSPYTVTEETLYPRPRKFSMSTPADIVTRGARETQFGSTNTADVVEQIALAHHETGLGKPGLAIIQTDGLPDSTPRLKEALARASKINLFFVFVGYGSDGQRALEALDAGGFRGQVVDNVATVFLGDSPTDYSDEWVMEQILKDVPKWRKEAHGKVQGTV